MKNSNYVALYGAGRNAKNEKAYLEEKGISPVCFVDLDSSKWGTVFLGLPVLSLEEANKRYKSLHFYITPVGTGRLSCYNYLLEQGIGSDRILYMKKYTGCEFITNHMIVGAVGLWFCCESNMRDIVPTTNYQDKICDTVSNWLNMRTELITSFKDNNYSVCKGCRFLEESVWHDDNTIRMLTYGKYAPCQLSCVYCTMNGKKFDSEQIREVKQSNKSISFPDVLRELEERNLISRQAIIGLAAGEITVDPERDKIFQAIEKYHVQACVNAVIFNEQLAYLTSKGLGCMSVSVDAGTPETYKLVKGIDAFDKVWSNIELYVKQGVTVYLKYVFIPENSNTLDIEGFVRNAVKAGVKSIDCSLDYFASDRESEQILHSVAEMITLGEKYKIPVKMYQFSPHDDSTIHKIKKFSK